MRQIDREILDLKEEKQLLMSLERLMLNADFKKVILEGYLKKHPLQLLKGKGVLGLNPQTNEDIDRQLDSVALFDMYLNSKCLEIADIDYKIDQAETLRLEQHKDL